MIPPTSIDEGTIIDQPDDEIWVRSNDRPHIIAEKIVDRAPDVSGVKVAAIGAAAVNQAVKGIAVARQHIEESESVSADLAVIPYFSTITDADDNRRTRIILLVYRRSAR